MALPGVNTVLKDRFYSLSRTNIPEGPRVAVLARRAPVADLDVGEERTFGTNEDAEAADYKAVLIRSEQSAIARFGEWSELHRAYLELLAGGAARIYCVPIPDSVSDEDLLEDQEGGALWDAFGGAEVIRPDIIVPWGRGWHPSDADTDPEAVVEPLGFYADDGSGDTIRKIARMCAQITDRTYPTFAVLGVSPLSGAEEVGASTIDSHLLLDNLPDRDSLVSDPPLRHTQYVSVVVGEITPTSRRNDYPGYSNGAGIYAGLVASLDSETSPTGRRLPNIVKQRFVPNRAQQIGLISDGVVPIAQNFSQEAVVVDAQTFAREDSDYTRLSTLRITFDAIQLVRRAAEDFVGQPATLHNRNALETAIASQLRNMKVQGALVDADYNVTYEPRANRAHVDLVLVPAFEMRNIEITISVQL